MSHPTEELFFQSVREHRGAYFVTYQPPVADHAFGTLCLTFPDAVQPHEAADWMKLELRRWLERYPVPLMVSAFDEKDSLIDVRGPREECHLVGWLGPEGSASSSWKLADLTAHLNAAPAKPDWRAIYADIPFRTKTQVVAEANRDAQEFAQGIKLLQVVFVFWLAILPAGIAAFEFFGPEWLGLAVLAVSWWKAWQTWLRLTGRAKPSPSEQEKAEKERKMAHYFHHCERNPEGFSRLKAENFEREARARTRKEAADLAKINATG